MTGEHLLHPLKVLGSMKSRCVPRWVSPFIVLSASDTASPRYCLGLLTLTGSDPLVRTNWKKTPHPVFEWAPQNSIYGPGRGTFAEVKDGSMWLLYAAKPRMRQTPHTGRLASRRTPLRDVPPRC